MDFATLLGTTGFGAIIGAFGGLINRWMDYKTKTLEIEISKENNRHAIDMRKLDLEAMQMEVSGKIQVATIEGEATVEAAGYSALSASYAHDSKIKGTPITDGIRAIIRPAITAVFLYIIGYVNWQVWGLIEENRQLLTDAVILEIIRWTLFEAGVVIGWWFAMRPAGGAGLRVPTK